MRARLAIVLALMLAGAAGAPSTAQEQAATERELARVRDAIAELERDLERQIGRRDDGMAELREIELSLASTRAGLASLDDSIAGQSARLDEIAEQQSAASVRLEEHQAGLAEQARMSYMTGRQELVRLLLSQDNPADFGRMLVYYDYLNRYRSGQIAAVNAELTALAELAAEQQTVRAELERLRSEQLAKAGDLEREQMQRRHLLAEIDAAIESSGNRIEQMRAEEAELDDIITRLNTILEGFPIDSSEPFAAQKGELRLPIDGEIAAAYGEPRDPTGQIRWKGMLLAADAGTVVRAVYHGQVVHAQWAPHMGLLLIIQHSDDYLSLYGFNSALLRQHGDWVQAGEPIAEVGDTGGQQGPGLYFGIVHEDEAVDPADWVR